MFGLEKLNLKMPYRHCAASFSCTPSENFVNCSIRLKKLRVTQ